MELLDRIFALHHELQPAHRPIPVKTLAERLECSESTVKRVVAHMRNYFQAPIATSRAGYMYKQTDNERYELPGLWFNPDEILALLACQQLLDQMQPGLLTPMLKPLRSRIDKLLDPRAAKPSKTPHRRPAKPDPAAAQMSLFPDPPQKPQTRPIDGSEQQRAATAELARRICLHAQSARRHNPRQLGKVAEAIGHRLRLRIRYHSRGKDELTRREVSPQRLTYYRDNWYLETWCHRADDLRRFSLDRIDGAEALDEPADEIDLRQLAEQMDSAYGIFSGTAEQTAVLLFTPERARWVADECWHPQQRGQTLEDGSYRLEVPYSDQRELILDLLRYGPDVEVLAPAELREKVVGHLQAALAQYRKKN